MTVNSKMTALADEIRELSGSTSKKSIDDMTSDVGSANTEVASQTELIAQIATALEGKASNSGGTILPTLDNPAVASDILSGKEAIDGSGNKITGSIATKTSSNLTASGATVTVPAGYYASNATKSVTTVTQATPTINIDTNGKITASATQSAGYVSAGTKSGTKQMTVQAAKTITPSTSSQTAVAKNVYTTGAVTVAGDVNLKAENIKSGVSIFGVSGTHEGGTTEDLTEELTEYTSLNEELEAVINSLPSAGGSGGIETCTVTLTSDAGYIKAYVFSIYKNGVIDMHQDGFSAAALSTPIVVENVICNSACFISGYYALSGFSITNGSFGKLATYSPDAKMFTITADAGSNVTINCYSND